MSDVHAEHAPGALMDPTDSRGTLGAHVVAAKGRARARRLWGVTLRDDSLTANTALRYMAGVGSAPPEPASDEIELSAPPFRLPTPALSLTRVRSLAAILRSVSCQTSPSGRR